MEEPCRIKNKTNKQKPTGRKQEMQLSLNLTALKSYQVVFCHSAYLFFKVKYRYMYIIFIHLCIFSLGYLINIVIIKLWSKRQLIYLDDANKEFKVIMEMTWNCDYILNRWAKSTVYQLEPSYSSLE